MNDNELLNKLYYKDLIMTGSNELYKKAKEVHPKITMKIVKEWLSNQQSSQMNNKPVKKNKFKPIYAEQPYSFQIDLTFSPRYKNQNSEYYILLIAININTRFGYVYYSKDKEMTTILKFTKDMEKKTKINVIKADKGCKFNNSEFKTFCEEKYYIRLNKIRLS